jgi:hypothetical protein
VKFIETTGFHHQTWLLPLKNLLGKSTVPLPKKNFQLLDKSVNLLINYKEQGTSTRKVIIWGQGCYVYVPSVYYNHSIFNQQLTRDSPSLHEPANEFDSRIAPEYNRLESGDFHCRV